MTPSAWISAGSSSPNAAWMPPCAFAELQAWRVVFVASPTRAPARSAETAAARPDAPLPMTSTSQEQPLSTGRIVGYFLIAVISSRYSKAESAAVTQRITSARGHARGDRQADLHHRRPGGPSGRGGREDEPAQRRFRGREGLL